MGWTFVIGPAPSSSVSDRELTAAFGRTITWRLDAACSAQFAIDARHDEALGMISLGTDLTVYDPAGVRVFRGRLGPESDSIGPSSHTAQFAVIDYRGMLEYAQTGAGGASFNGVNAGAIAWSLISTFQALPGGNWGITDGAGSGGGTSRVLNVPPGKPVVESIDELARLSNGMEWEIDANRALNRWYPTRGANNGVVLDYGGMVAVVRRELSPAKFANSTLATGQPGLTPRTDVTAGIAVDPVGRWETSAGFPTIENQASLDAKGPWMLGQSSVLRPAYSVTFAPGRWEGPSHVWIGDTVTLAINSGRLAVNALYRVVEISVQPGDNGDETVRAGLLAVA